MPRTAEPPDPLRESEDLFIEAIGSAIELWGFRRILGHVWGWLYLAGEPRSAGEIGDRLGLSKAAVSTAVGELERWGCVHRLRGPGERREMVRAEDDVWRMVSRVFRERELRKIDETLDVFDDVRTALKQADVPSADRARVRQQLQRVERISTLARLAQAALRLAIESGRADLRPLWKVDET